MYLTWYYIISFPDTYIQKKCHRHLVCHYLVQSVGFKHVRCKGSVFSYLDCYLLTLLGLVIINGLVLYIKVETVILIHVLTDNSVQLLWYLFPVNIFGKCTKQSSSERQHINITCLFQSFRSLANIYKIIHMDLISSTIKMWIVLHVESYTTANNVTRLISGIWII